MLLPFQIILVLCKSLKKSMYGSRHCSLGEGGEKAVYVLIFHRNLLEDNPGGIILSTDDYFYKHGQYHYDPDCLGEAHEWNRKRGET